MSIGNKRVGHYGFFLHGIQMKQNLLTPLYISAVNSCYFALIKAKAIIFYYIFLHVLCISAKPVFHC